MEKREENTLIEIVLTKEFSTYEVAMIHKRAVEEWLENNYPLHLWPDSFEIRVLSRTEYDRCRGHEEI